MTTRHPPDQSDAKERAWCDALPHSGTSSACKGQASAPVEEPVTLLEREDATRPSATVPASSAGETTPPESAPAVERPTKRGVVTVRWGHARGRKPSALLDGNAVTQFSGGGSSTHAVTDPTQAMAPPSSVLRSTSSSGELTTASDAERFVDCRLVARGGMGTIHVAKDNVMLRQVALKFLCPTEDGDPSLLQQFVEEAQITGQLAHPNIVPVYDLVLQNEQRCFFSMKYVDGETYTQLMQKYHSSPNDSDRLHQLLQVFLKVCDAIAFAHDRGVIHCDLKPDNVMVGKHGQVYVMDWGVAVLRSDPSSNTTLTVRVPGRQGRHVGGTPSYMAPEQAWGRPEEIDQRTDVYGLGGLLHYLLTGKPPNYDTSQLDGMSNPRDIARESLLELVPPGLCRIAERALATHPYKRHPSVVELKAEVERFIAGGGWFATETFAAGETIIKQGESGDSAYVITGGECDVYLEYPEGAVFVRTMRADEVFGEMAVLTGRPRSATVTARTDVQVNVITKGSLELELGRNPLLGAFVRTVVGRFSDHHEAERLSFAPPSSQNR